MLKGLAYYNWGRWVVDCPADGCTDARQVHRPETGERRTEDVCARGHHFRIVMPDPGTEAQIVAVLSERAEEGDQGWYPDGHQRALAAGQPTGQSIAALLAENREVAEHRARRAEATRDRVREALAAAGIQIRPDGTFEGAI